MSNLKKFSIICNEGSLSGSGKGQKDIKLIEWALDKNEAANQFNNCRANQMYGRRIKSIQEERIMKKYIVTGKKPEENRSEAYWHTIADEIDAPDFIEADRMFRKKYPDHSIVFPPEYTGQEEGASI